jgi:uncharacterized protein DUF5060
MSLLCPIRKGTGVQVASMQSGLSEIRGMTASRIRYTLLVLAILLYCLRGTSFAQKVHGDLKQWHRVVIDFSGPSASEQAEPNPFTHYRLNVDFVSPSGRAYRVPGFYAADGQAAETSATSGSTWRVCFTPDCEGNWDFLASFRTGENIAMSLDPTAGTPTAFDLASGRSVF